MEVIFFDHFHIYELLYLSHDIHDVEFLISNKDLGKVSSPYFGCRGRNTWQTLLLLRTWTHI